MRNRTFTDFDRVEKPNFIEMRKRGPLFSDIGHWRKPYAAPIHMVNCSLWKLLRIHDPLDLICVRSFDAAKP